MPKDNYIQQGWGLANRLNINAFEETLVASDGSSKLKIVDPVWWKNTQRISVVKENGQPLDYINELEIV